MTEDNELQRFKHIVATIALSSPEMNMQDGIRLALRLEEELADTRQDLLTVKPAAATSITDPYDIAAWLWDAKDTGYTRTVRGAYSSATTIVYDIDTFWDHMLAPSSTGWKISAIKEARGLTGAGLKEAKEAVILIERHLPGRPPRTAPF